MSLNNIVLSATVCHHFYRNSLIGNAEKPSKAEFSGGTIRSMGSNNAQIIFLVNDRQHSYASDEAMDMLLKLLAACKLSMEDIALINCFGQEVNYDSLTNQFRPKKTLLFGVDPAAINLPFMIPFFQVQRHNDQSYLFAPALEDFLSDTALKKKLWTSLQKIFF